MAGARRKKLHFSKFFSFSCGRGSALRDDGAPSQIGGPGFSRVAFANDPDCFEARNLGYGTNYVSTTKYNLATFVPKSLFEQFRRVANIYFLVTGCLSFTELVPYGAVSAILPLIVVIGATMAKEAVEDWRRNQQDKEMNNRKVRVHSGNGNFDYTEWKNLRVGDVVKVEKDNFFPADLLLLSSSYDEAICYVETMNLDGETNLKLKQSLEVTSNLLEDSSFRNFKATIRCEDPNANLYTFVGTMDFEGQQYPLSPLQLLLRDSKLRNTDFVYGVVIFTGHDTKVMQNATNPPSKRSRIERKMDKLIYLLLCTLVFLSTVGSIYFGIKTYDDLNDGKMKRWYLRPDDSTIFYDPKRAGAAAILHFLTAMMLYGYFIPISLYISIEIVKVLQTIFMNQDTEMYHEETDTPAHARTSNLNEELGQVDTILSDKTGTLTCNSMEFIKCSIAGTAYGRGVTEVEKAMAKRKGSPLIYEADQEEEKVDRKPVKGFNFKDGRVMNGNWINEPNRDVIQKFFRVLAICHTAIPEVDEATGNISYEAESPDEAAFVIAARELGFEFYQRTQTAITLHELDPLTGRIVDRSYRLLNILEFNSTRKRMSVIVRNEDGKLLLLTKGADSVMFERLAKNGREFEEKTKEQLHDYADAGLRTLVLAYRELDEAEYEKFNKEFMEAKNLVSADRDEKIDEAAEKIEKDLILLGATAVEDKLQNGVPECIDKLAQAGIKIWVLTGDKMETAINIGFACSLLRQGMKQIIVTLESPDIVTLEKEGNKDAIAKASKESVVRQISEGKKLSSASSTEAFALIIDGKSLAYALEDDVKHLFLQLAVVCGSVICCRSSPKQKALVTRLVKEGTRKVTLAIGDGANDVGMLQEADIGIGISGAEGMQAVMSSDIAIAQFRFLERLLLVHGHWCYRRISSMICYFFYKNITFGVTLFLYEAHTSFSAHPLLVRPGCFCSLLSKVPSALPRRRAEPPLQLEAHPWLDDERSPQRRHHILPHRLRPPPPSLPEGRPSPQPRLPRHHHLHRRRVGRQLPDCPLRLLLHAYPARVHMGRHRPLVPLPARVRGPVPRGLHHRVHGLPRGPRPRGVLLARDPRGGRRDPDPVLRLRRGPDEVLPDVPRDDTVDTVGGDGRGPRVLPHCEAEVGQAADRGRVGPYRREVVQSSCPDVGRKSVVERTKRRRRRRRRRADAVDEMNKGGGGGGLVKLEVVHRRGWS